MTPAGSTKFNELETTILTAIKNAYAVMEHPQTSEDDTQRYEVLLDAVRTLEITNKNLFVTVTHVIKADVNPEKRLILGKSSTTQYMLELIRLCRNHPKKQFTKTQAVALADLQKFNREFSAASHNFNKAIVR